MRRLTTAILFASASGLLIAADVVARSSLHQTWFHTGWILLLFLGVLTVILSPRQNRRNAPWMPSPISTGSWGFCLVLYQVHTGFRLPRGGFEVAIAILFCLVAISALVGYLSSTGQISGPRWRWASSGWEYVYLPCSASLLVLSLLHGILAHAHGYLAYLHRVFL